MIEFVPFIGVIEDIDDPTQTGRVRCRVFDFHSADRDQIPTNELPWAQVIGPTNSASLNGIGLMPHSLLCGSYVIGLFLDGKRAQEPVILGSIASVSTTPDFTQGFSDPNSVYPKSEGIDVSDIARGVSSARANVSTSLSGFDPSFDPVYPYNRVWQTESGHLIELDDTEGAERTRYQHKSGSFEQIDSDGSRYLYIASDDYCVIEGSGAIHVKGDVTLHIDGNANINVTKKTTLTCPDNEIDGELKVTGDVRVEKGITTANDVKTDKGISLNNHKHRITTGSSAGLTAKPQ